MSLSTVARPCCLKETRPDVFWRANMGFVIVFTQRPLMPEFCLVTAVSSTAGGKQQDSLLSPASLYLSSPNTHTLVSSVTSNSLCLAHYSTHAITHRGDKTRQQTKSSLMAVLLEKMERTWKADPFKVQPGARSLTARGIFIGFLCLLWGKGTHQTRNGKCNRSISPILI